MCWKLRLRFLERGFPYSRRIGSNERAVFCRALSGRLRREGAIYWLFPEDVAHGLMEAPAEDFCEEVDGVSVDQLAPASLALRAAFGSRLRGDPGSCGAAREGDGTRRAERICLRVYLGCFLSGWEVMVFSTVEQNITARGRFFKRKEKVSKIMCWQEAVNVDSERCVHRLLLSAFDAKKLAIGG